MDFESAVNKILLDENFHQLNKALNSTSIFHMMKIENQEVPFSRLLTWILNPHSNHGMGDYPLKAFLRMCCRLAMSDKEISFRNLPRALDIENLSSSNIDVIAEYKFTLDNSEGRLDIYASITDSNIDIPLLLVEVKIDAKQHDKQTYKYLKWIQQQKKDDIFEPFLIYLLPEYDAKADLANGFLQINFEQLNEWLQTLQNYSKSNQASFIINELVMSLAITQRVNNYEYDSLANRVKEDNKEEIEYLKKTQNDKFINIHDNFIQAFNYLGIRNNRIKSKGISDAILIMHEIAEEMLIEKKDSPWKKSGGIGSFTLHYNPIQEKISGYIGVKNAINVDFWMDRNHKGLNIAVYSIKGNINKSPYNLKEESHIRRGIAEALRQCMRTSPVQIEINEKKDSYQIGFLNAPHISGSDTLKENQKRDVREDAQRIMQTLVELEPTLQYWSKSNLKELFM